MEIENSENAISLRSQVDSYIRSLYNVGGDAKHRYTFCLESFVQYLENADINSFEGVSATIIGQFLSTKPSQNTRNLYIFAIKNFFTNFLGKDKIVKNLHQKTVKEAITPSELLTPEDVITLANEAGKRRDQNKVIILILFESCARIHELLGLRIGDVVFSSVVTKDGNRKLIATLHFKRSKGNVDKQPVVLTMFASELKRWVDNHPFKGNIQSYLFPSPRNNQVPIESGHIGNVIWNAAERLGMKKRTNPHWFRHSGLSYFVNNLGYNEEMLKYRAGWTSTMMASRYIHSGAEQEARTYLEKMGYQVEEKKETKIMPKTCPHCQAINPYTNSNCDLCAMPLNLEEYTEEIAKKRSFESLCQNLDRLYTGKLSDGQKEQLSNHTATMRQLMELKRDDLATQYFETLLKGWMKMFLTQ